MKPHGRKNTTVEIPPEVLKQSRAVERRRERNEVAEEDWSEDVGEPLDEAWKHEEGLFDAE